MDAWKAWWSLLPNLERVHNLAEIFSWICAAGIALSLILMWWTGEAIRHQTKSLPGHQVIAQIQQTPFGVLSSRFPARRTTPFLLK
jgi:hypothetical protein